MRKRAENPNKKCVSPWVGLLLIVTVCVVMSIAIFFGARQRTDRPFGRGAVGPEMQVHYAPYGNAVPADSAGGSTERQQTLVF